MKRMLTLSLAALLILSALTGCTGGAPKESETPRTPEQIAEDYKTAIEGARDEETNQAVPVLTAFDADMAEMILPMVGITDENATAFAVAISPINVKAYGIAAIMPAEGKSDEVLEGVKGYVELMKGNFELYLADQYDIANSAKVETLDDGTVLLVMCEDQDTVFDAIKDALSK